MTVNTYNQMAQAYDDEIKDFWQRFPIGFIDKFTWVGPQKAAKLLAIKFPKALTDKVRSLNAS